VGLLAVAALALHGAHWLAHKCEGALHERSRALAAKLWPATALLLVVVTAWTARVSPSLFSSLLRRPWGWPLPLAALAGLAVAWRARRRGRDRAAFLGSTALLAGLLLATAAALFPTLLRSTVDPRFSLDAVAAAADRHGLLVGLAWWIPALLIALGYFTYLFRSFAGKVHDAHHY
jgi:cytochrome d ubiquinol oxidase subunit II